MSKRKEPPVDGEAPPKKKGFWRKVWDKGGKHVAIAAGAAAGTYALGKGAQYLDQRSGGKYSAAIGRAANAGRDAIGRARENANRPPAPPPRPGPAQTTPFPHVGGGFGVRNLGGVLPDAPDVPASAEPLTQEEHQSLRSQRGRLQLLPNDPEEHPSQTRRRRLADPADIQMLSMDELEGNVGPSGVHTRRPSLRADLLPTNGSRVRQIGFGPDFNVPRSEFAISPTSSVGSTGTNASTQSEPIDYATDHPPVSQRHRRQRRPGSAMPRQRRNQGEPFLFSSLL